MSEMKFNLKGPVGAIVAILVIAGFICYRLFMPFSATTEDKRAIKEELERLRGQEMSMIAKTTLDQYKNTGKIRDTSKEIKDLSGDIKIISIDAKKGFIGGIKVKVTYTISGNTPKVDGGVRFFKLYRRKRSKNSYERITEVTQISEDTY